MTDAVILSDMHLGGDTCQAPALLAFLDGLRDDPPKRLILNGDVFDSIDFRRLKKKHWKVLSTIRKLSDEIETVWVHGNHDGEFEHLSHLLGVRVVDEFAFESAGKRILCLHGHRFDEFIAKHRFTTWLADRLYRLLQKIDSTHTFARSAKRRSKLFLRNSETIEAGAIRHARQRGADAVCCGHTHLAVAKPDGPVGYFNSGCWTEVTCHFLTVTGGVVELHARESVTPAPEEFEALGVAYAGAPA